MDLRAANAIATADDEQPSRVEAVDLDALDERYGELRLRRPGVVAALRRSIERDGLLRPLLVNLEPEGRLCLVDGFKRALALRALGVTRVLGRVVQLDAAAVRVAIVTHNASYQGLCELEQAWVVHALVRSCRLSQSRVATMLGRHKSWVCRRLMIAERLDEGLQQDMRLGLVSAALARELVRLPRGNQARVALCVRGHGFSSRRTAVVVDRALRCHSEAELVALLRHPWGPIAASCDGVKLGPLLDRFTRAASELLAVLVAGARGNDALTVELTRAAASCHELLARLETPG